MFKFADTESLDVVELETGAYALVYSEACEKRCGSGYTLRHYPGQQGVNPWTDESQGYSDFKDLAGALCNLGAFPAEDAPDLIAWLSEQLARATDSTQDDSEER